MWMLVSCGCLRFGRKEVGRTGKTIKLHPDTRPGMCINKCHHGVSPSKFVSGSHYHGEILIYDIWGLWG